MKFKTTKVFIAFLVSIPFVLILIVILNIVFSFNGNPISKYRAKKAAEKYIEENYQDLNLDIVETGYDFKFGYYYVTVQSPDSIDTVFSVHVNGRGKVLDDDYEYEVANNFTTVRRYERDLREIGDKIFREQLDYNILHAALLLNKVTDEEALKLTKDMPLDIQSLPINICASIMISDEDVSYEKMGEVLVKMDEVCKKENIPIGSYSIRIEKQEDEMDKLSHIDIYDIPAGILEEDNIPKALEELDHK